MHSSTPAHNTLPGKPWKARSVPIDLSRMRHSLCGLLNKLARSNFDAICARIIDWAVRVDRVGDLEALGELVRSIFVRGLVDHVRSKLYAMLCQRIMDELEGERSLWKKMDVYHLGNPVHSFETDIRLLAHDEFDRILAKQEPSTLIECMSFAGELLVHGVIFSEDLQDLVDALFDSAERDDEERTVALCRFLARLVGAFDAYHVLSSLQIVDKIERVLTKDDLSPRTRFLLMSMLEQVVFPRPQDAFSSTRDRIEVYGVELDDSETDSVDAEESDVEEERIRHTCSQCVITFLANHDQSQVQTLVEALKPSHRYILVQEFLTAALHGNDSGDALSIGSLLSSVTLGESPSEGNILISGISAQLAGLEDTSLDAPHAPHLMASLLQGTGVNSRSLELMVERSLPESSPTLPTLLAEMRILQDCSDNETDTQEESRRNRFERDVFVPVA